MKPTLLIVDDLEINRVLLSEMFLDTYHVIEADSGEQALSILESRHADINLILLDLIMPGINGLEVLAVRSQKDYLASIPVVVITSSDLVEDQIVAFEHGANDYVTKPFIPEIVISRVNNVLEAHKRMSELMSEREQSHYRSESDPLTGLYNKKTTEALIEQTLSERFSDLHALLIIDVDNFKSVNDIDGHLVGDHTLKIIADLISSQFRHQDIIGRVGGDKYIVFMQNIKEKEIARKKAADIVRLLQFKPNLTIPANVSISIGLTYSEHEEKTYTALYEEADKALYFAKENGKSQYVEYGVDSSSITSENLPIIILNSVSRNINSTIAGITSNGFQLHITESVTAISDICRKHGNKVKVIFVDISNQLDDGNQLLARLRSIRGINMNTVIAICEESNMEQFKMALSHGVTDIVTSPVEIASTKRKLMRCVNR